MNIATDFQETVHASSCFQPDDKNGYDYRVIPFATRTMHLDVQFSALNRVETVSRILESCLERTDGVTMIPGESLGWTLSQRLQGILAIMQSTSLGTVTWTVECPISACHESMELEVDLQQFMMPASNSCFECDAPGDHRVGIRLPTGVDLIFWRQEKRQGQQLEIQMARSLVQTVDGQVPDEDWMIPEDWLDAIGTALEEHDGLNVVTLHVQCPSCGGSAQLPLELEGILLQCLAREQRRVMQQVHELARAYHWSEDRIMAIPFWRREHYLACLNQGESR